MSSDLKFLEKLDHAWEGATEGLCVQAFSRGKKVIDVEIGKTYKYYDWASLTKIVFSTTAWMLLYDEKSSEKSCYKGIDRANARVTADANDRGNKLSFLTDYVYEHVPWFPVESEARLKNLLSHSAGLTWWYPFFKSVAPKTKGLSPEEAWLVFEKALSQRIRSDFKKQLPDLKTVPATYSDLDFFVLGSALQEMTQASLLENWKKVAERVGFEKSGFSVGNEPRFKKSQYAPTETCLWRGETMQGKVHDENAWSLKGVAPHAGLFGPINELSQWGLLLRRAMRGESTQKRFASHATTQLFTTRSVPARRGDWALGFMMPSKNASSAGRYMSLKSVGHTGFTGTSLWYDPVRDVLIVVLSNRVYPTRENKKFVALRAQLHDWVNESIVHK